MNWCYQNAAHSAYLFRFGLPSSKIVNSIPHLMNTLLPPVEDEDRRRLCFFVFLLGLMCADGNVAWQWSGTPQNTKCLYTGFSISARDTYIIGWIQQELERIGCVTTTWTNRINYLFVSTADVNTQNLLLGLNALQDEGIPLDGKLSLLREFLLNQRSLPYHYLPPRKISFYQYLGPSLENNDRVACLIGQ